MNKNSELNINVRLSSLMLSLYILLSVVFFIFVAYPVLNEKFAFQFYADSMTYIKIARGEFDVDSLVQIDGNFLGPLIILTALNNSFILVYLFNLILFFISYFIVVKNVKINRTKFLVFLFMSPLLFSSLHTINKEIISVLVVCLLWSFAKSKKVSVAIFCVLLSILVRWQLTLFVFMCIFIFSPLNIFRNKRLLTVILLLLFFSFLYSFFIGAFEHLETIAKSGAETNEGKSGIFPLFLSVQRNYGYFIIVIPKAVHLFVGLVSRVSNFLNVNEVFNDIVMFLQSVSSLILLVLVIVKKKFRLNNDAIYLTCLFTIIFGLTPIYSPRYLFPVYILLAIALAEKGEPETAEA